jgi:hypothetical protein
VLVTETVRRLAAAVRIRSMRKEMILAEPTIGRLTVSIIATSSRIPLTAEMPAKRAALFQLVFIFPF